MNKRFTLRLGLGLVVVGLLLSPMLASAYDWKQFNGDEQHSGNNTAEATIAPRNVNTLHRIFSTLMYEVVDGAPAYLSNVVTDTGTVNTLFMTSKAGVLLAVNADSGAIIWARSTINTPRNDLFQVFTTSSAAIDPNSQYVYTYGVDGYAHKFGVSDGSEVRTGGWPQLVTRKTLVEKGSSALAIATAHDGIPRLYVANGGYPGDSGDYQGHITTINLNSGQQTVFNATCSDLTVHFVLFGTPGVDDCENVQSAIWARPGIVYSSATDRIYLVTGNGVFDGNHNWGDSVLALRPDGSADNGRPLDSYTPDNYVFLNDADLDLGSANLVLLPSPPGSRYPHLGAQSGKESTIALLNLDAMSGPGGPGQVGGALEKIDVPQGGPVLTAPVVWTNPADGGIWMFISSYNGISSLQLVSDCAGEPHLIPRWQIGNLGSVTSPLVANNVLYYTYNHNIVAAEPTNGITRWQDSSIGLIHWESPIVANGTLYVTDEDQYVYGFRLDPAVPSATAIASNTPAPIGTPCPPSPTSTPPPPTTTPTNCPLPFSDLGGNVFLPAIQYLYCRGVVNGTDPTHYTPHGSSTRAQFAKVVTLGFGIASYTPATPTFTDVPSSYFAYTYIESGYHAGILSGFDAGTCASIGAAYPCYGPNRSITRAQLTKLVVNAAGYTPYTPTMQTFNDVPPSNVFYASIETAHHIGVINGYPDNTFRPNNNIRRDEMAQIVFKAMTTP